jgi:hypothetical protein
VSGYERVGGFVGESDASSYTYFYSFTNCYATGSVSGDNSDVGGFAGSGTSSFTNCYATGNVSGDNSDVGGFMGNADYSSYSSFTNCYYLNTAYPSDPVATPKTATEMRAASFVTLLNGAQSPAPWFYDSTNINNGYPILAWQMGYTSIEDNPIPSFMVSPNPTSDKVTITAEISGESIIEIMDLAGNVLYTFDAMIINNKLETIIDLSG